MFELIPYYLSNLKILISTFFILLFIIGCTIYVCTRNFNFKDGKIKLYGLLLHFSDKDIVILSAMVIRLFMIVYCLLTYSENIKLYIALVSVSSLLFIISYFRNLIYEVISSVSLVIIIYFNFQLKTYLVNVENTIGVYSIHLILICFALLYAVYLFLKELEELTTQHENITNV